MPGWLLYTLAAVAGFCLFLAGVTAVSFAWSAGGYLASIGVGS